MFIEMWFFVIVNKVPATSMVGPFKTKEQCSQAQTTVEKSGFQTIIPCYKAQ